MTMRTTISTGTKLLLLAAVIVLVGCQRGPDPNAATPHQHTHKHAAKEGDNANKEIEEALAQLPAEDRALATAQGYCAVMQDSRLGEMGPPLKITVKNQPVFLCCKGCKKKAEADPDKTLAKVEELKAKTKAGGEDKK